MRKLALLLIVLVLVAGCSKETATPTPSPTSPPIPPPTPTPEMPLAITPSGPATCVLEPLEFQVEPRIPPMTEEDHVHGPADAPITFFEYADFQ